jgi:DNA polymerase-3 subunit alpha
MIRESDGRDQVVIYIKEPKAIKRLPRNQSIQINKELVRHLATYFDEKNVKVVEKSIENK